MINIYRIIYMSLLKKENLKYLFLILAIMSCAYGIYSGEMEVVFSKAVKICLECCGIG